MFVPLFILVPLAAIAAVAVIGLAVVGLTVLTDEKPLKPPPAWTRHPSKAA